MAAPLQRALIIGGGIGGLCAAVALHRGGVAVAVYEQAETLRPVGAGLTLWTNAIKALRRLGLADPVLRAGSKIERAEIRTASGRTLSRSEPGALEKRLGEPTVAVHRADLHAVLLSALPPDTVRTGAKCSGFQQDDDGVTAHLTEERSYSADLLIGADGIHSAVRAQLFPEVQPRYSGYTAWRGVVEAGNEAFPGATSESWGRGARFGIVPIGNGRIYWFATANAPAGRTQNADERKRTLQNRFQGWHPPIERLIDATPARDILHNDIYDLRPMRGWSRGRVVLLGDAAHPTTPNLGQGACMAIESGVELARCVAEESDLPAALRRYEARRMPRTAWITEQSWKIGRVGQIENPLACRVRDFLLSITPPGMAEKTIEKAAGYEP